MFGITDELFVLEELGRTGSSVGRELREALARHRDRPVAVEAFERFVTDMEARGCLEGSPRRGPEDAATVEERTFGVGPSGAGRAVEIRVRLLELSAARFCFMVAIPPP